MIIMKEKEYLPPRCTAFQIEHCAYVCASTNTEADHEDFEVDLVEF